jgi:hypothetical protein
MIRFVILTAIAFNRRIATQQNAPHQDISLFVRKQQMLASIYEFKLVATAQQTIHNYSVVFGFQNCHTFVRD